MTGDRRALAIIPAGYHRPHRVSPGRRRSITGRRGRLMEPMTRAGSGHSTKRSAVDAAGEATRAALAHLDGQAPGAVLVFANPGYNLPSLLQSIRAQVGPGAVVCGCSSEGIVFRGGC